MHSRSSVRFFARPELPQVQVVIGRRVANTFPRHVHQSFNLGVVEQGARVIVGGEREWMIPAGGVFILNPAQPHLCRALAEHSYTVITVSAERLAGLAGQIAEKPSCAPYFGQFRLTDEALAQGVREFGATMQRSAPALECQSLLLAVLSRLLDHAELPPVAYAVGVQHEAVRRVQDYIDAHHACKLTLDELAQVACLSAYHFQRVFVKATGLSPHDYLIQCRIRHSLALLRAGGDLAGVGGEVGFADQSHFTHSFKRVMGIPPGQYVHLNSL